MPNHTATTHEKRFKAEEAEQERCRRIAEMVFAMLGATGIPQKLNTQLHMLFYMTPRIVIHEQPFDPVHPVECKNNVVFLPACLAGKNSVLEGDDDYPFTEDVFHISVDYEIFRAILDEKLLFLCEFVSEDYITSDSGEPLKADDLAEVIKHLLAPNNYTQAVHIDATGGLMS